MLKNNENRRNFLKKAALGSIGAISLVDIVKAATRGEKKGREKIKLGKDDIVLFQGDSITDAGRNRESTDFNTTGMLGSGYAMMAAADLLYRKPDFDLKFYNKGISGNKVYQLAERWDAECLKVKPNVLSILIGVNDYWHSRRDYKGTAKIYRDDYRALLAKTRKDLPDVKLIIGEPFAVNGIQAVDDSWYPHFDEYRTIAREMAGEFDAFYIPYQDVFDEAAKLAPGSYWTYDGVHPSLAGSQLMAVAWLEAVS